MKNVNRLFHESVQVRKSQSTSCHYLREMNSTQGYDNYATDYIMAHRLTN